MGSLSAASSSRGRSASPFRFRKSTSDRDRVPGFFNFSSFVPPSYSPKQRINYCSSVESSSPLLDSEVGAPPKESVCVTVRFRPLNSREIQRGDEVAWYAEGDTLVRNEYNPATVYAFDKVFGPTTTTRGVYDVAARHVVRGAMEGINGTVFAYGVTSSGKTHTMHGDQKSPGIIPLAIKDVFNIIQDTVGRDFLLRVSYLEIYNEIINDLLNPEGQNLRVREDYQGTYVEGIKEEVVISPAHALSLIAAGEAHRHVGSNNFNLFSSRSHTIFSLTIESNPHGDNFEEGTLSQLNLIDLAGSESSKTETTGLRRKEGAYINKSLLTLGTVISKLSDVKSARAGHIPYRDSKLTRLLQSSLSGHGRVSLICTLTPALSNMEETHNTLKFAFRAKKVELHTNTNRIVDERSLIRKYQKQIATLKQELDRFKRGYICSSSQEDLVALKQKLEAGQVKMQSRLEEEEQAKAALMGRIQRLTKLILVSTKNTIPPQIPEKPVHRRRHSFAEDELACLPVKRRDLSTDLEDDEGSNGRDTDVCSQGKEGSNHADDNIKDEKKNRRRGMLSWFKTRKADAVNGNSGSCIDSENNSSGSPTAANSSHSDATSELQTDHQKFNKRSDELTSIVDSFPAPTQAGELFSVVRHGWKLPSTGTTITDQMELLREQTKMLAGEVALCTSSLKRLTEQATNNPDDEQLKAQVLKMEAQIKEKQQQMDILKQRMSAMGEVTVNDTSLTELQQTIASLTKQLDEKTFELEIKSADNRILQEQWQSKLAEFMEAQETIAQLREQLEMSSKGNLCKNQVVDDWIAESIGVDRNMHIKFGLASEEYIQGCCNELQGQMLLQAAEVERLKQEKVQLLEEKEGLQIQGQKLAEEASYAKELASDAAVELKILAEEVTRLSYDNRKLREELEAAQNANLSNRTNGNRLVNGFSNFHEANGDSLASALHCNFIDGIDQWNTGIEDMKRELQARKEREASLEAMLAEKSQVEAELLKKLEDYKKREEVLENDLAGMWVLVADLKKEKGVYAGKTTENEIKHSAPCGSSDIESTAQDIVTPTVKERQIHEDLDYSENVKGMNENLDSDQLHIKAEDAKEVNYPIFDF